jgi:acetyltransferase-like isoleucine patch superfamily enzyme
MSSETIDSRVKIDSLDGFRTIPQGGLKASFWSYVERVTGKRSLTDFFWRGTILTLFSMFPTVFGCVLRGKVYKAILGDLDSGCFIEKNVRFNVPKKTFLGRRVYIGECSLIDAGRLDSKILIKDDVYISRFCSLRAGYGEICIDEQVGVGEGSLIDGNGKVEIGKYSLLARGVVILTGSHIFNDQSLPIRFQGANYEAVKIGEDVWLGAHVTVLPGVTIGDGSVVGSGSVVSRDVPNYSIVMGVPARIIGKRGEGNQKIEHFHRS